MKCLFCKSDQFKEKFVSSLEQVEYFICSECGCHSQTNPIDTNYNENYWEGDVIDPDGKKRNFIEEKDFKIKNWYGDITEFTNNFSDPKVLDVGCGLGFLLSSFKTKYKTGIEASNFCVDFIKKNFQDIHILKGGNDDLNRILSNTKFDIIIAYHVIEHLDDPVDFIKNLKMKLNKSGKLIIGTPCIGSLISKYFGKNYRLYNKSHKILLNEKSLKQLFEKNGFKIVKIEKPFFKTAYNNFSNFVRLFNKNKISPPFYGSIITIYAELN